MYKLFAVFTLALIVTLTACKKDDACSDVTYSQTIAPIIAASCATAGCHDSGAAIGDFTTHAGIAAAANAGHVKHEVIDDKTMPPSGALSDLKQDQILCWINAGAPND